MKYIKKILMIALFGVMSYGAYSAYENIAMTDAERLMIENIEALTLDEIGQMGRLYYRGANYYCCRLDTPDKACSAAECPPGTIYGD